jgi:hypothetical protein
MNNITRIGLSIVSGSLLAVATWALPAALPSAAPVQDAAKGDVKLQSVSGTISTVQRDSFTLVTSASSIQGAQFQRLESNTKTMMFIIDQNTTVDGKLKIGANADVIYRVDAGNNMAVSVTVSK